MLHLIKKQKTCTVFLSSYTNTSGSLGEREMLWEHEPQASVSTNLVPRAFSSTIFKMADRREKTLAKAGITWYKISKNLGDFYHVTFWERPKQNGGEGEAKHRSKDALTLYTRQRWLRSKLKYCFNGCFDSGAGIFSVCKFIPLSYSLYFW